MSVLQVVDTQAELSRYLLRLRLAAIGATLLLLVLFGRFAWLQVIHYEHYRALAENNRIAMLPAVPGRGGIMDRNGNVLASNITAYTLEVTPSLAGDLEDTLNRLGEIVTLTAIDRRRFRKLLAESKRFASIPLRGRLSDEEIARFAVNRYRFPGVDVHARQFRQYPYGETFSHVVGYIGRINDQDLSDLEAAGRLANYRGSDHMGKLGIEKRYEDLLHGQTGVQQVEVDAGGQAMRVLSSTPPQPGATVTLNLDATLQQVAATAFGDYRGALVALDPRDGAVLALYSNPGFDPNLFIDGIDSETWKTLNDAFERPLINRALRGVYPPGSTIKPFMALGGLSYGLRNPGDTIIDPGYYSLPGSSHRYRDWRPEGHGSVDLKTSITVSCDTYYYRLAEDMGIRRMGEFLGQFGFGQRSEIDLDGEMAGLMPSPEWKQKRFKQPWWPGETLIAGIGQGYTLATPMQLALATMGIANGGVIYRPRLLRSWANPITGARQVAQPEVMTRIPLRPDHVRLVREAMIDVTAPGGTAAFAGANTPYLFAGKTGTAQVKGIRQGEKYDERSTALQHRDHALFIGYAPADAPKIVVAVLVENGGHGGSTAAPMARQVIDYWLLGKRPAALTTPGTGATPDSDPAPSPLPLAEAGADTPAD